jgi:hypothetical protein
VRQACRDDSGLRREVASLLANHSADPRSESWAAAAAALLSISARTPGRSAPFKRARVRRARIGIVCSASENGALNENPMDGPF